MILINPVKVIDSNLTASNIAETDYAAWSSATTYALGARVIVVGTNIHKVYESLVATNLNHIPGSTTDIAKWIEVGETNKWRMFNSTIQTQSSNLNSINVTLHPTSRVDSIALLGISAYSVQITMTDATDGVVYDHTTIMSDFSGINNWYQYFFEPVQRRSDFLVHDLPPYANASINVILTDTGNTVYCGALIAGLQRYLGDAQYGAKVGITDYSVKTQDPFGNYTVLQRAYRKTGIFTLQIESGLVDYTMKLLSDFRSTPILYAGADEYDSSIVYGFYKDLSINIAYSAVSLCTLEIEGLT
jgi:hypothetical protein